MGWVNPRAIDVAVTERSLDVELPSAKIVAVGERLILIIGNVYFCGQIVVPVCARRIRRFIWTMTLAPGSVPSAGWMAKRSRKAKGEVRRQEP
jgi:hypothetical protein